LDEKGNPVDARDLFHKPFLGKLMEGIFRHYHLGFVGTEFSGDVPVDFDALSTRMVDEMGVDRHMEEILRIADQKEMTEKTFVHFLEQRGGSGEEASSFQKGREDITLYTGPHLGGFNHGISLPELIESIETMDALCFFNKYSREKR